MERLPVFPAFDVESDKANAGPRWDRWVGRMENLFVALELDDAEDDTRKRALLLHYVGERVYDIYQAEKAETGATYAETKKVLSDYFKPRKNTQMEVYTFRTYTQKEGQTLDEYVTELRRLAKDCEFAAVDKEILSQVIQHCRSNQLRRRALREPDKSLADILQLGRAMELSYTQAQVMERNVGNEGQSVNAVKKSPAPRGHRKKDKPPNRSNVGSNRPNENRPNVGSSQKNWTKCWNCAGRYPHRGPCPAKGQTCYSCNKQDHFGKCCPNKKRFPSRRVHAVETQGACGGTNKGTDSDSSDGYGYGSDSDSSDGYCYGIRRETGKNSFERVNAVKGPYTMLKVHPNKSLKILVDSGSSVNILDESDYREIGSPALNKIKNRSRLIPYGGKSPLQTLGTCSVGVETDQDYKVLEFHVVKGENFGSIMGYPTACDLSLIKVVNQVQPGEPIEVEKEFSHLFKGIGKLKNRKVKLHIDPNVTPVAQRHRKTPFHLRDKVKKEIAKLLDDDIIEKAQGEATPWISPIVTPPKKDTSEIRLCVDMRQANKAILRERHVMPTIDELILELNGSKVYTKLDLRCGYHQLELEPESKYITTFSTHLGIYRYKRLNFGISSASEVFQEAIRQVVQNIPGARNISDDILVHGKDNKEHDKALRDVLQRISDAGLTLNKKKGEFRKEKITFYGVVFSGDGISADPEKVRAVREFGRPQNVKEMRSFLWMTNYCSRFIKNYASICAPLRELTHQDKKWHWSDRVEDAFVKLKARLSDDTVMAYYDPDKPIEVRVDASPVGLAAILVQDKIVSYASRSLTPVESRYSQVEREALGVVWGCEHFDIYLRGAPHFTVITDHKPLEKIWEKPQPPLRIERWGLRLQPYKFTIRYERGEDNIADYMSRHPVKIGKSKSQEETIAEEYVDFIATESVPRAILLDDVREATLGDKTLQKAIELTRSGRWYEVKLMHGVCDIDIEELTALRSVKDELTVHSDNMLLRDHRIVLPSVLRDRAIQLAHEGHQGLTRTKSFVRSKIWFPGIDAKVEKMIGHCTSCQSLSPEPRNMAPLKMSELPSGPWENLSMDFCGPLNTGDYLLVIVDEYSRYPVVEIVRSVSANATIPVLDKVLSMFSTPKVIKTDNGSPFNSGAFREYAENMGFVHRRITPRWPRANAQAEGFNKPLMKAIRAAHIDQLNWKQEMFKFLRQYRATPHVTTGQSPHMLMFMREPNTKLPQIPTRNVDPSLDEMVRRNDSAAKYKMKQAADKKNRAIDKHIKEGDKVMIKHDLRGGKLQPTYKPQLETVIDKKGPMVTVSGNVTRNVSRFKKVYPDMKPGVDSAKDGEEEIKWPQQLDESHEGTQQLGGSPPPSPSPGPVRRSSQKGATPRAEPRLNQTATPTPEPPVRRSLRSTMRPGKYKDFVM